MVRNGDEGGVQDQASRLAGLTSGMRDEGRVGRALVHRMERALELRLPPDVASFMAERDGAEGFVAGAYLAIWPVRELQRFNALARAPDFIPGVVLFATNGGGDAYGVERATQRLVEVPMIGMSIASSRKVASSLLEFLEWLAGSNPVVGEPPVANPATRGKVVHEVQPILLGGDPVDLANKALLSLEDYLRVAAWWNERIGRMHHDDEHLPDE